MYPRTFAEFFADYPTFVRMVIAKQRWCSYDDIADLEQELLTDMLRKQVVESFNAAYYGDDANIKLFLHYVKLCLRRTFLTMSASTKIAKRSVNNTAVSLSQPLPEARAGVLVIEDTIDDAGRAKGQLEAITELDALSKYIKNHHPDLSVYMDAARECGTLNRSDIAAHLGIKESKAGSAMTKIRRIARQRFEK